MLCEALNRNISKLNEDLDREGSRTELKINGGDADRDGDEKRPKIPLYCYLCGPPEMIKQIANILISVLNVPEKHVFYEMWW